MESNPDNSAGRKAGDAESILPYAGSDESKTQQVEKMFDNIAPAYDRMNALMSLGMHIRWRRRALRLAADTLAGNNVAVRSILDIATGTGDVAIDLAKAFPDARVIGSDISTGMLGIARRKLRSMPANLASRIVFQTADCLNLPYADGSFQLVTVAYGVRNFEHLDRGYSEMSRVLAPGGVLCVVELSRPRSPLTRAAYDLYARHIIPLAGRIASGDNSAYSYLPESIAAAPQRRDMAILMRDAGLQHCRWMSLSFGAVTIYLASKPTN